MSSQTVVSMPSQTSWTKALLWKEFRQVMQLMLTVLGLGFGTLLIIVVTAAFGSRKGLTYDDGFWFLFLSMPMMYATGVGILLVGTEKESRSMQWMRSLPVSAKYIAWSKLVVALVTLALVWLIAGASWAGFASFLGENPFKSWSMDIYSMSAGDALLPPYLMVSLFLCLSGLAFAWRFESQILSLLMLIPAALAVWSVAYGLDRFLAASKSSLHLGNVADSGSYLASLSIGSVIAVVYGWRTSQRELAALAAPVHGSATSAWAPELFGSASANGAQSEARSAEAWTLWPSVTPISGMLWQMIRQNGVWWSLISIASLVVLAAGSGFHAFGATSTIDDGWIFLLLFPIGVLSGLLGVLAFQSDGIQQRVRFYADRGVSPTVLWWTRHWIPVTMLLGIAVVRYLTLRLYRPDNPPLILVDTMAVLAVSLAAYIVGQWVSQFIKSPILSAIILPAVLLANLAYCTFTIGAMETPWWLLIPSFAIIAISTCWMMRPWMERRIDWKYYLQHGGFVLAALAIPLVPGLWKIWNLPSMPSEVRTNLEQLAMKSPSVSRMPGSRLPQSINFGFGTLTGGIDLKSIGAVLDQNEQVKEQLSHGLLRQATSPDYWLAHWDPQALLQAYWAELAGLQNDLIRIQGDPTLDAKESLEKYQAAVTDIPNLVSGLRATKRLRFCDLAERIELIALGQCMHSKAREWMGDAAYQSVTKLLADDQARDQSRRLALATAWWETKQSKKLDGLDGYLTQSYGNNKPGMHQASIPTSIGMLQTHDLFVADLWRLLELTAGSSQAKAHRQSILSKNAWASSWIDTGSFIWMQFPIYTPAETWRGDWEVLAKKLVLEGDSRE
jgi:hypothetical protein